jgi:uncharacterized membrane protein YhhN
VNAAATAFLVLAGIAAVGNWIAVARECRAGIYVCKPLTLALLIASACTLDPTTSDAVRVWFVIALVLSLFGDVFLMLPGDVFVAGLGSFLLAHGAYIVGLNLESDGDWWWAVPVAIVVGVVGTRLVQGIRRSGHTELAGPVIAYVLTIAVMVASALASGNVVAGVGAVLFMTSDSLIGEHRFVRPRSWQPVAIMVSYHLAQALLVVSLVR